MTKIKIKSARLNALGLYRRCKERWDFYDRFNTEVDEYGEWRIHGSERYVQIQNHNRGGPANRIDGVFVTILVGIVF